MPWNANDTDLKFVKTKNIAKAVDLLNRKKSNKYFTHDVVHVLTFGLIVYMLTFYLIISV